MVDQGNVITLVAEMVCFDPMHDSHLLRIPHNDVLFYYTGLLEVGFSKYTICDAVLAYQFPMPRVVSGERTKILAHAHRTWTDYRKLVDACSGFGGMSHGAAALGIKTMVAVDSNELMTDLHMKHDDAVVIVGDVGLNDTIFKIWSSSNNAAIMSAGFACQPYSKMGDQRCEHDPRSASLTSVLRSAYYLQVRVLILECVTPARHVPFVQKSIQDFVQLMGFRHEVVDLKLDSIWPCRRARTWWVLSAPELGPVGLSEWSPMSNVSRVHCLVPYICRWHPTDELALSLDPIEMDEFGAEDGTYANFLLKPGDVAPCFLHAYGSQLRPCPCGCRVSRLSAQRLAEKGLVGCLVHSATDEKLRHLHPSEVLVLCGMDPTLDFGENVRLTLSAIGQLASPLQVVWVMGFVSARVDIMRYGQCDFQPSAQLMAFRSWLLMRAQQVWPCTKPTIDDVSLQSLVNFWGPYKDLFLGQLVDSIRWADLLDKDISLAAILDAVIRNAPVTVPENVPMDHHDEPETPWIETVCIDPSAEPCMECDSCVISFVDGDDGIIPVHFTCGATIHDFLTAHAKLVGPFCVEHMQDSYGSAIGFDMVLEVEQLVSVHLSHSGVGDWFGRDKTDDNGLHAACRDVWECGPLPKLPSCEFFPEGTKSANVTPRSALPEVNPHSELDLHQVSDVAVPIGQTVKVCLASGKDHTVVSVHDSSGGNHGVAHANNMPVASEVSPTVDWTYPCVNDQVSDHSFDVPTRGNHQSPSSHAWSSAAALLGLEPAQFVKLQPPVVQNADKLAAVRHQFLHVDDRIKLLERQQDCWADDEIRFHLQEIVTKFVQTHATGCLTYAGWPLVLDPLISATWLCGNLMPIDEWCHAHPEVLRNSRQVLGIFRVDAHWVPVQFVPNGQHVNVFTWDSPQNSHDVLNQVLEKMTKSFGFDRCFITRHQRLFFTSVHCGALAVHFIQHVLFGTQLPTCPLEAAARHAQLREKFVAGLGPHTVPRPWVWGHGDDDEHTEREWPSEAPSPTQVENPPEAATGSAEPSCIAPIADAGSHICISVEDRIMLFSVHGRDMADDEMRFHLQVLVDKRNERRMRESLLLPIMLIIEPLYFWNWDEVGHILTEKWCLGFPTIRTDNIQIVSVMWIDEHWIPLWFVPGGRVLVVHTFNDTFDHDIVEGKLRWMGIHLGFEEVVIHCVPLGLPDHRLCGAHALAFLAHIMLDSPLPESLTELEFMFTNMRASFVQAVYENQVCRCPILWGAGGNGALMKSLAEELMKHGVPSDQAETRSAQAIRAIGSEQVIQALQQKQPWRQLKALATNASFKMVLPSELAAAVEENRTKEVGKRPSKKRPPPGIPAPIELDPTKLQVLDGTFRCGTVVLSQLTAQQIGPVSSGFVLMNAQEAEPYLSSGKVVSQEPLALVVFHRRDVQLQTMLSQMHCTVPCRCLVDNEPILADATLVQIGTGCVEKHVGNNLVTIDSPDVRTVKITVFRDEYGDSWENFCKAPIRSIVALFPALKRCSTEGCSCSAWHNEEGLNIREPILDLWRRQFLKQGFKPVEASKADFFVVSIRIPLCLLDKVLRQSGHNGAYVEPRSADGKLVLDDFMVIWTPKHTLQSLQHTRQINPAVIGLVRVGDRRGLRVPASQAQEVHRVVKPDTMFLPQGVRTQYVVGPFPFGLDRQGIARTLKLIGWDCKPLQPASPQPGKGAMWLVQAVDGPPHPIVHTSHGEILISKHKGNDLKSKVAEVPPVAAASTLALCGNPGHGNDDPWSKKDPWGGYQPTSKHAVAPDASASLQQLETRIQSAILSKLPQAMEQDDVPDRLSVLENQFQQMIHKQNHMETQFADFSAHQTQQVSSLQNQLNTQAHQMQGQLEQQNQSIQAMFETQLAHIRRLLSKRTREEGE